MNNTLPDTHVEILRLLAAGKRIMRSGYLWRLIEPSFEGGIITTQYIVFPGGNAAIDALLQAGYVAQYQSKAGEFHGYMVTGRKPLKDYWPAYAQHDTRYRVLDWTDCHSLYLTELGREALNNRGI